MTDPSYSYGYAYRFDATMPLNSTSWSEQVRIDGRRGGPDWLPLAKLMGAELANMFERTWSKAVDAVIAAHSARVDAADPIDIDELLDGFVMQWAEGDFGEVTEEGFSALTTTIDEHIAGEIKGVLGVTPNYKEASAKSRLHLATAETIKKMKGVGVSAKDDMAKLTREAFDKGLSTKQLGEQIQEKVGIGMRRSQFVARNEMGNLYTEHTKMRHEEIGVTEYIWRTSLDERVRAEHGRLEGEKFTWDKPPDVGHPGQDYNCRCTAEAVLEDIELEEPVVQIEDPRKGVRAMREEIGLSRKAFAKKFGKSSSWLSNLENAHSNIIPEDLELARLIFEREGIGQDKIQRLLGASNPKLRPGAINRLSPTLPPPAVIELPTKPAKKPPVEATPPASPSEAVLNDIRERKLDVVWDPTKNRKLQPSSMDRGDLSFEQWGTIHSERVSKWTEAIDSLNTKSSAAGGYDVVYDGLDRSRLANLLNVRKRKVKAFVKKIDPDALGIRLGTERGMNIYFPDHMNREPIPLILEKIADFKAIFGTSVTPTKYLEKAIPRDLINFMIEVREGLLASSGDRTKLPNIIMGDVTGGTYVENGRYVQGKNFRKEMKKAGDDAFDLLGDAVLGHKHGGTFGTNDADNVIMKYVERRAHHDSMGERSPFRSKDIAIKTAHKKMSDRTRIGNSVVNTGGGKALEDQRATIFHEFGHFAEDRNGRALDAAQHFLNQRKGSESISTIYQSSNERGWRDDFYDHYVGKLYGPDGNISASEIFTMGFQEFITPVRMATLWQKDPGHFVHIMNVLEGRFGWRPGRIYGRANNFIDTQ